MYYYFHVAQTARDTDCSWSQPNASTLAIPDLLSPGTGFTTPNRRQFVFPSMKFNCSGNIRKINFVASRWSDINTISPQIQLWSSTDGVNYRIVGEFDIDTILLDGVDARKYYSYTVDPPLPFESGNVLGIFSPRNTESRLRIAFWNTGSPASYRSSRISQPLTMVELNSINDNNIPFINVETGM